MNATDRVLQRCAVVAIYGRKNAKFPWTTPFVPAPFCLCQIAAIARANGMTLATNNVAEFGHVSGLLVEDWEQGV